MSKDIVDELRQEIERLRKSDAFHIEACAAHQRHIDELQAVVDRLPKTADVVPIVPGDYAWDSGRMERLRIVAIRPTNSHERFELFTDLPRFGQLYSTREAAERANQQ